MAQQTFIHFTGEKNGELIDLLIEKDALEDSGGVGDWVCGDSSHFENRGEVSVETGFAPLPDAFTTKGM